MTTQATDRTAMRERLIAIAEQWVCSRCSEGTPTGLADAILAEFPEIGQQPHIDPALRERIAQTSRKAYYNGVDDWYASAHESRRSWYRIADSIMALIDSIAPAAEDLMGPEDGIRFDPDTWEQKLAEQTMFSDDTVLHNSYAAQPQIDREELRELIAIHMYPEANHPRITKRVMRLTDEIIAHLNAAPAAQPLPTRSEFQDVLDRYATHCVGTVTPFILDDLIAAGFAREDEPEPQVVWDEDAEWSKTCDLMRMAVADPFTRKRQDNEAVERILADFDARKALAADQTDAG